MSAASSADPFLDGPLKIVVVGNVGTGKSVLASALANALDIPVLGIDDCRFREGDGSAAGETAAWTAFLAAIGEPGAGVFECSGTGPFADLLRHALGRSGTRTVVFWLRAPFEVCQKRIAGRVCETPYSELGVPPDRVIAEVEESLVADRARLRQWPGPVIEIDATKPPADLITAAFGHLGANQTALRPKSSAPRLSVPAYQARWRRSSVSPCETFHIVDGAPLYSARFERVLSFHAPGLAPVRIAARWCHIEATGRPIYAERYRQAFGFYDGRAAVEDEAGWFFIGTDGRPVSSDRFAWVGNFQGGRAAVRLEGNLYAHVRADGTFAYPSRFRYVGDFRDGLAVVQDADGRHLHIDPTGATVREGTFEDLDVFHKGHARARDARGWHHVDRSGRPAYDRRFAAIEPFYNGQARVERSDGGLEVIDEHGVALLELRHGRRTPLQRLSGDLVGFWRTQTVAAAVEVGVFDALPGDTRVVSRVAKLDVPTTRRLLRALWDMALVERDTDDHWRATETGVLLARRSGSGMDDAARIWGDDHYRRWLSLVETLRASGKRAGPSYFEALVGTDLERYQRAIDGYARHDYAALPETIDWSLHRRVIDVGGGQGALLFGLLRQHTALEGRLLDLPLVVDHVAVPSDVVARCQVIGADFFRPWPERADAVVLARVLHDWPDAEATRVLANARAALEPGGRVYVLELLLRDDSPVGGMLDLNMLVMTGGRERTEGDFRALFEAAGLRLIGIRSLPSVSSILIGEAS